MDVIIIGVAFIVGMLIGRGTAPRYSGSDALRRYLVRDIRGKRRALRSLINSSNPQ